MMIIIKKLTKEEAGALTKDFISRLSGHKKELRTALAQVALTNVVKALCFTSLDTYFTYCIAQAEIDITVDYARKQCNAGLVELQIFGKEGIGTMKEGALRPLYENVDECNRMKVYQFSRKGLKKNEFPTGVQIIEAAKKLKLYKQQISKLKNNPLVKRTNGNGIKGNDKPKVNPDNSESPSKSSSSNVVHIQSWSSDKASKTIIDKYQPDDIRKILGFLRVTQNEEIQNQCSHILNNCKEKAIENLIKKLSQHLKVTAKVRRSNKSI